jgi:S1-C subfamily serine protease
MARKVARGESCWLMGNPLAIEFNLTQGIISKTDLYIKSFKNTYYSTDAVALPGNSGCPVYNSHSELVGILVMSTSMLGSLGASGLGIIVRLEDVKEFLK